MISYNGGLANWPDCRPSVVQWSKSIGRSSASGSSNVDMPDDDRRDANQPSPISDEDSRGAEANGAHNGKNRTKLFDQLMAKSKIKQDMEDREVEQDYLEARRLTLEKAQADLLAGFGVGFPVLAGLHYVPARHPLLPTAMQSQSELLNLKMIRSSPNINGSGNPSSGSSAGGTAGCRESPLASSSSPEPEDLSMHTSPRESNAMKEQASPSGSINANSSAPQSWSFEEQFKQLYELSEESKRKDFLDELFSFMQKRGTPVTRIPIMAKQVLDLYELYKLVVSHGGLVEVINKKMWREITKGLNLPSSITSAAFTLRTQYMKYLYPYECEKEKLSSPAELQSAIDGNRREGRRSGYHPYSQISPTLLPRHHMNGGAMLPEEEAMVTTPSLSQQQQAFAAAYREQALALEAAQRQFERNQRDKQRLPLSGRTSSESNDSNDSRGTSPLASAADATPTAPLPPKRAALEEAVSLLSTSQDRLLSTSSIGIPTAHIKVTSRNDGRSTIESSLVVSMEINGVMYQGVLFAQPAAVRMNGGN